MPSARSEIEALFGFKYRSFGSAVSQQMMPSLRSWVWCPWNLEIRFIGAVDVAEVKIHGGGLKLATPFQAIVHVALKFSEGLKCRLWLEFTSFGRV